MSNFELQDDKKIGSTASLSQLTSRERRFVQFASNEFRGQLYMTPQDFLVSPFFPLKVLYSISNILL